jgi:CheY-like chemotaxis protein
MMMKARARTFGAYGAAVGQSTGPAPVLVIDDEPADATTTLGRLAEAGYSAVAESNGDAVLRLVRADLMRFVVSELYVPCAEGTCVVAALKRDRTRLPRLRVLAHSRHTTPSDDAWALAAGCDGVLHKPGSADALIHEIRWLEGTTTSSPASADDHDRSPS